MLPQRKHTRLKYYDYNKYGFYFLTLCTQKRRKLFCNIVGAIHESPECKLTRYGIIVKNVLKDLPNRFDNIEITDYVIMPNHIHLIIWINRAIHESPLRGRSEISKIVGYLKMNASKQIHEINKDEIIWQRGYYDHVIRDETDYYTKANYILNNPLKWHLDELYVE
ncbi:MAG: transposase [Clostridiales bacterium]|nr:transposase [Clostridiales bacterium]